MDGTTDVSMMLMSLHGGGIKRVFLYLARAFVSRGRLIPRAPALPTFGDERAIGARLQPATDKMLIAPEATA